MKEFIEKYPNNNLVRIDSFFVDVTAFKKMHPGGVLAFDNFKKGEDVSEKFRKAGHLMRNSAMQQLKQLIVA